MQGLLTTFFAPVIAFAMLALGECSAAEPCGTYRFAHHVQGLFYLRDDQGREAGVDVELIRELARRTGCRFVEVLESRVRIWDQFRRGALDLTRSAAPSPEREELPASCDHDALVWQTYNWPNAESKSEVFREGLQNPVRGA